jgi:hypothetical protein
MPSASQITNPATVTAPTGRSAPSATRGTAALWLACLPARVSVVIACPRPCACWLREGAARRRGHQDTRMRQRARAHQLTREGGDGGRVLHPPPSPWRCWPCDPVPSYSALSCNMLTWNKPASAGETPLAVTLPHHPRTNVENTVFATVRFDPGSRRLYIF